MHYTHFLQAMLGKNISRLSYGTSVVMHTLQAWHGPAKEFRHAIKDDAHSIFAKADDADRPIGQQGPLWQGVLIEKSFPDLVL